MQTSNFWRAAKVGDRAVAISREVPDTYSGRRYKRLAPPAWMCGLDAETFAERYRQMLGRLDARQVWQELGADAVLLCWEPPGQFCHRRLVAEWLERELGEKVGELGIVESGQRELPL